MKYYNEIAVEIGDIVTWHDPGVGARKDFKVEKILRDTEGDEILLISDGFSEAEVPLSELEPKAYEFNIYEPVKGFYKTKHMIKAPNRKVARSRAFAIFSAKEYENPGTMTDGEYERGTFVPYDGPDMTDELTDENGRVLAVSDTGGAVWCKGKI